MNEIKKQNLEKGIEAIKCNLTKALPGIDLSSAETAQASVNYIVDYLNAYLREWKELETRLEEPEDIEMDFEVFSRTMKETADNLKRLRVVAGQMRWQFGGTDNENYAQLETEINKSVNGWMSSQC